MSKTWRRSFALIAICLLATAAQADHTVGNPGDPVRLLMTEAVDDTRVILIRVPPQVLQSEYQEVHDWYRANYEDLQEVVKNSQHVWIDEDRGHCALANMSEMRIYFFYDRCQERVVNKAEAIKLLIHENAHLLGLGEDDETLCDRIALGVYNTWLNLDINTTPRWDDLNPNNTPSERAAHASVSFKDHNNQQRLFVYGGCNENDRVALPCSSFINDGGLYNADEDEWEKVPAVPAGILDQATDGHRAYATAVYTGKTGPAANQILVFGGCSGTRHICDTDYDSVLAYHIIDKRWRLLAGRNAPRARSLHHAHWTGTEMVIWGGIADRTQAGRGISLSDGAAFDPITGDWRAMPSADQPSARRFATATFTGQGNANAAHDDLMIVFGGCDRQNGEYCPTYYRNGAVFDLDEWRWSPIADAPLTARGRHAAVWTGEQLMLWGGLHRSTALTDGALVDITPQRDGTFALNWQIVSSIVREGRYDHQAVWTGDRVLVWGGLRGFNRYAFGLREYTLPGQGSPRGRWRTPDTPAAPVGRRLHAASWIGDSMLVWGGTSQDRAYLYSGGRYFPKMEP